MDVPRGLPLVEAPARLFRLHIGVADGLDLPPWRYAHALAQGGDLNFGGRFDDPHPIAGERFRTLSLADNPVGAALEVYQSLRPDTELFQRANMLNWALDEGPEARAMINVSDLTSRSMSIVGLDEGAKFVPITNSRWRAYLEREFAGELMSEQVMTMKTGDLLGGSVELPQRIAEFLHDRFPDVAGITIPSTLGDDYRNYYVFEGSPELGDLRAEGRVLATEQLSLQMPAIQLALDELRLDVALDNDNVLVVRPKAIGIDVSLLPVVEPPATETIFREEMADTVSEQGMTVVGRSEDGTRIVGRSGAGYLSISRAAFKEAPLVDDRVSVSRSGDVDTARTVERQITMSDALELS